LFMSDIVDNNLIIKHFELFRILFIIILISVRSNVFISAKI